jgi:hypothetical protein
MDESSDDLIEALSQHLPGGTEVNDESLSHERQ